MNSANSSLVNAFPFLTPSVTGLSSGSDNADAKAGDDSPARASDAARSRQGAPADRDAGPVRSHEERDPPEAATAEGAGGQGADHRACGTGQRQLSDKLALEQPLAGELS